MKIITAAILKQLQKNYANANSGGNMTNKPVLKLFGGYSCTWLVSEIASDGDTMFALCDLGQGSPELGYVSLRELLALRFPPLRLPIERDRYFTPSKTLVEYADEARASGRIVA